MSEGRNVATFFASLSIMVMIGVAAVVTFFLTCNVVTVFAPRDEYEYGVLAGILVGIFVAYLVGRLVQQWLWNRKDT